MIDQLLQPPYTTIFAGIAVLSTVYAVIGAKHLAETIDDGTKPNPHADHSYETPPQWDEESPLRWCESCGTFNHIEYRFCRTCTGEIHKEIIVQPQSINRLKKDQSKKNH